MGLKFETLIRSLAPVIRNYVADFAARVDTRFKALEERVANVKDGEPGRDGSSFIVGVGAPTADGKSGNAYLDATTGDVYRCL